MEPLTGCFTLLAAALSWSAWQAWRLRNARRDVWLIGATGGASGVGAALVQWL